MKTFHLPTIPPEVRRVCDGRGNVYQRDEYQPRVWYRVSPSGVQSDARISLGQLFDIARDHQLQEVPG